MEEDRYTRITLRIPKDLHSQLQKTADDTSKSTNAEIVARLQNSFTPQSDAMDQLPEVLREAIDEVAEREGVSKAEAMEALSVRATAYSAVPVIIIHYGHAGVPLQELRQFIHDALHDAPADCSIYVMK